MNKIEYRLVFFKLRYFRYLKGKSAPPRLS